MENPVSEKKLRIAVLGTRGIPGVMGGVETHCEGLYPRLAAKGHRVTVFARKGYIPRDQPYKYEGVLIEPLWALRKKSLEAVFHTALGVINVALRRRDFDLLHIHAVGPSLFVPLARLLGLKVVMTHHGEDYNRSKWGRFAKRMLRIGERLGCTYADSVIAVSRHILRAIRENYGRDGNYIPNGVPLPEFIPPGENMARFSLTPGRYVLAVGRFVPEKGFHDLVDAFGRIDTGWKLVIAGTADHADDYSRSLLKKAGRDKRVVLTGFIKGKDLGEVYSNAGLFVLPSYHEGLPIALLEAMSYNLPVIASAIPANMEILSPEETFPAGDVQALNNRLSAFLAAPKRDTANRERVASAYNWDRAAELTEKVYGEAFAA